MQFVAAFNALGYEVPNPRQDWSAEKADGICITLWRSEVDWTPPPPRFDVWSRWEPGQADWQALPGNTRRIRHLDRAMNEFGGRVDVVIITGTPGEGYGSAEPWFPHRRLGHGWRITKFDQASGFFAAAAEKLQ